MSSVQVADSLETTPAETGNQFGGLVIFLHSAYSLKNSDLAGIPARGATHVGKRFRFANRT